MLSLKSGAVGVFVICVLNSGALAGPVSKAQRIGTQKVTTFAVLDHLKDAQVQSPFLPSDRALFHKVDPKMRRMGTTLQNPWGGDGAHGNMHVRVRKQNTARIEHQLHDCLVLPLPARADFELTVLADSELRFAPEYVRLGNAASATLSISVLHNGLEHTLFSKKFKSSSLFRNKWEELSVSLAQFAGQRVKLRFQVDREKLGPKRWKPRKRGGHKGVALFALPRVLTRVSYQEIEKRRRIKALIGDEMNHSVIMFVFDSMRADLLSPVREQRNRIPQLTPNLDAAMKKGVTFTRAFSVGNQTRSGSYTMYLGMPPSVSGTWQRKWAYSPKTRRRFYAQQLHSLPRTLHEKGYLSGHLGYNSFLYGNQYLALDMGFDFVSEFMGVPQNTVTIARAVNEWLDAHKDEKFFLLVWLDPPHFPYIAPKGYRERVYKAGVKKSFRYFAHGYLAKLIYGDEYFGKIARHIDALGLSESTLQIVTADHGECMDPRHDGYSKNVNTRVARHHGKSFFDEEIHVPLMLRLDGTLAHRSTVDSVVSLVSLAPTIQDLLALDPQLPRQFGRSFAGLAKGNTEASGRTAYFEGRWSYGIRTARWKYIFHDKKEKLTFKRKSLWQRKRDGYHELFDLALDPDELTNLSRSQAEALETMKVKYAAYRDKMRVFRRKRLGETPNRPMTRLPWEK